MTELALTDRESRRLKSLEDQIGRSAGDMYDAMRAIHDEKLYRDKFTTFAEYCEKRWNMSPRNAYRLMEHGRLLDLLSDTEECDPLGHISERVTREVAGLPDTEKVKVIEAVAAESKAQNNGKPKVTAAAVRAKVQQHQREPGDESEATGADPIKPTDKQGQPIPDKLTAVFEHSSDAATLLRQAANSIGEILDMPISSLPESAIRVALKDLKAAVNAGLAYAVCPYCKGRGCKQCETRGYVTKDQWAGIPEERRK